MSVADLHEARKFMESISTWFYKTNDCSGVPSINDVIKKLNILSECIQASSSTYDKNLCVVFDVANILIQQINESDRYESQITSCISQSCNNINDLGKPYMKNESLLLSGSKYKSLDTLAGCFTSVQAAGSLNKSSKNDSFIGEVKENTKTSHEDLFRKPQQNGISKTMASFKAGSETVISDNKSQGLQRESTWELGLKTLPATSSPVSSITEGLDHISIDEIEGEVILKLCNDTKSNMDRIERLLRKSLNRTHNLSKASVMNASTNSVNPKRKLPTATPQITRGAVGRFSLGAAKLPMTKRNVLTPKPVISPKKIIRPKTSSNLGASAVLQSAGRNIMTAKRRISSLASLKDFAPQSNSKLKVNGKVNSASSIPSLRNGNVNSPKNVLNSMNKNMFKE